SFLIKYILDNSILNNNSLSMLSLLGLGIITSLLMFSIFVLVRKYFEIKYLRTKTKILNMRRDVIIPNPNRDNILKELLFKYVVSIRVRYNNVSPHVQYFRLST